MPELHHPPQERDTLPGRLLALIGAGVVGLTVVLSLIAFALVRSDLHDQLEPPRGGTRTPTLDEAHLYTEELLRGGARSPHVPQAIRARTWGWVDREAGLVHMPIETAMQLRLRAEPPHAEPPQRRKSP